MYTSPRVARAATCYILHIVSFGGDIDDGCELGVMSDLVNFPGGHLVCTIHPLLAVQPDGQKIIISGNTDAPTRPTIHRIFAHIDSTTKRIFARTRCMTVALELYL